MDTIRAAQLDKKSLAGQSIANPIQKKIACPANCQSNPIGQLVPNLHFFVSLYYAEKTGEMVLFM